MRFVLHKTFIVLGLFMTSSSVPMDLPAIELAQLEIPAYAKWGRLAVKETQLKYPHAEIIDYLHEGRETKENSIIEKFKLWLKDGDHEFGVFVRIEYSTETEKVINIQFKETAK